MFFSLPPVTRALIAINVVVFIAQQMLGDGLTYYFALWPLGSGDRLGALAGVQVPGFQTWQLVTYAFLHAGLTHLLFNMFALFMFGRDLEQLWGGKRFLILYFASIITAAFAQLA